MTDTPTGETVRVTVPSSLGDLHYEKAGDAWRFEAKTDFRIVNQLGDVGIEAAQLDALAASQAKVEHWTETAAEYARNAEFYRDLLDRCAAHLGPEVYVSDDGSVQDSPLRLKMPELIERLTKEREADTARLDWLEQSNSLHDGTELLYVVDGYQVTLTDSGRGLPNRAFQGGTLRSAIDAARAAQSTPKLVTPDE